MAELPEANFVSKYRSTRLSSLPIVFSRLLHFALMPSSAFVSKQRWLRLSEHRIEFDKWSAAGLVPVQSCPRRRADGACDVPSGRRGGQLVFTAHAARLIAGSVAE